MLRCLSLLKINKLHERDTEVMVKKDIKISTAHTDLKIP